MSAVRGNAAVPSLPPPRPRSPPEYPDLYGKRRELAKVQMLEREIGFLQEELKSIEGLEPASRSCKEVADYVSGHPDPLIPTAKKSRRSCRFWKWLCGSSSSSPSSSPSSSSCCIISWICCCCGCCSNRLEKKPTICCNKPTCDCASRCCNCDCDCSVACCRMPKCRSCFTSSSCCGSLRCADFRLKSCPNCSNCCGGLSSCTAPSWRCCCFLPRRPRCPKLSRSRCSSCDVRSCCCCCYPCCSCY